MIEVALIMLKFAALVVGGVFASIGLLTNYRHEDGTVSKWGKVALFGIVLSTIIGATTQGVESYRQRKIALANDAANRESQKQSREMLAEIRRAVYPLGSISFVTRISFSTATPPISTSLAKLLASIDPNDEVPFDFEDANPSFPKSGILLTLLRPRIVIRVSKTPTGDLNSHPDVNFTVHCKNTSVVIFGGRLSIYTGHVIVPAGSLILSERVASLEDLRGARLQMTLPLAEVARVKNLSPELKEMYDKADIDSFILTVSNHPIEVKLKHTTHMGVFEGIIPSP